MRWEREGNKRKCFDFFVFFSQQCGRSVGHLSCFLSKEISTIWVGEGALLGLLSLTDETGLLSLSGQVLATHDETTASLHGLLIGIEVGVSGDLNKVGKVSLVLGVDVDEGQSRGSLLTDNLAETSLTLNDDVWDTLLTAESGEPHNELDGLNVVGNDDQLGLLLLNEASDVLEAILNNVGLLGLTLTTSLILGSSQQTSLLLGRSLGSVRVQELEEEGGGVLVKGLGELVDNRGNLQALEQNSALALNADVAGPLDEASQVALGLNVTTDGENAGTSLNEGNGLLLSSLLASGSLLDGRGGGRGRGDLLARLGLLRARLQTNNRNIAW